MNVDGSFAGSQGTLSGIFVVQYVTLHRIYAGGFRGFRDRVTMIVLAIFVFEFGPRYRIIERRG